MTDSRRAGQVTFAYLFHWLVLLCGVFGPLGAAKSRLSLTGSFLDNFLQWDAQWFINIAKYGYVFPLRVQQQFVITGNDVPFTPPYRPAAFFPGLPLLIHLLGPSVAFVVTNLVYLLVLWLMYRLIEPVSPRLAGFGVMLFAINPCAIFFSSLYAETYSVLAVLLIMTGIRDTQSRRGYIVSLLGMALATSVHDLGVFAVVFCLRYIRSKQYWRALLFAIVGALPPMLYELYLIAHFHTVFALFAAEDSWNRGWKPPFVNLIHTIHAGSFSLNTLFVIIVGSLAVVQIVLSIRSDGRWRANDEHNIAFGLESAIWMSAILLLGFCAYIPGYPLMSVLRFFCILWPAFVPTFLDKTRNRTLVSQIRYALTGIFAAYAVFGAALFSHGWFFQ